MKKEYLINKYTITVVIRVTLCISFLQGCYYNKHEYLYPTSCDSLNVTFSQSVQPLLNANCISCHSGNNAPNGIMLDNFATVKAVASGGLLLGVITHAPGFAQMPKNAPKLNDCNIGIIRKWINDGSPNN